MQTFQVIGDPVDHSLSPLIHGAFAEQLGLDLPYTAQRVPGGSLRTYLAALPDHVLGLNVTLPLKGEAYAASTGHSADARRAQSVNTLTRTEGGWLGDNTDGAGLVRDLDSNQGFVLAGRHILVLGAGGAVRGIVGPLLDAGVARITVVNRTRATADRVAAQFGAGVIAHSMQRLDEITGHALLINATSAGWSTASVTYPRSLFFGVELAYDLSYGGAAIAFLARARDCGVQQCTDGRGMLVEQAAASFRLWHGVMPDTEDVRQRVDARLAQR